MSASPLSVESRAYIAGYFDGEGSAGTIRQRPKTNIPTAKILISQRDRCPLDRIAEELGFGRVYRIASTGTHVLQIGSAHEVIAFVRLVYPFVRQKKAQLRIAYRIAKLTQSPRSGVPVLPFDCERRRCLAEELFQVNLVGKANGMPNRYGRTVAA